MTDEMIREGAMEAGGVALGTSKRAGDSFVRMPCTLKTARTRSLALKCLSYSRLAARVRIKNSSIGVGQSFNRTDRCPVCKAWDQCLHRSMQKSVKNCMDRLEAASPKYFEKFDFGKYEGSQTLRRASMDFYVGLQQFVKSDRACRPPDKDGQGA